MAVCGIFGIVSESRIDEAVLKRLARYAEQRGRDSSGLLVHRTQKYDIYRAEMTIDRLFGRVDVANSDFVMGHSRLMTNGSSDNQPIYRDGVCVIHNGIVVNDESLWSDLPQDRCQESDTEVIAAIVSSQLDEGKTMKEAGLRTLELCTGTVSAAIAIPSLGKLMLLSNNGSLFWVSR